MNSLYVHAAYQGTSFWAIRANYCDSNSCGRMWKTFGMVNKIYFVYLE